jgi:hypothetical protein
MKEITVQVEIPVETPGKAERAMFKAVRRLNQAKKPGKYVRMEEHAGRYYVAVPVPEDEENEVRKIVEEAIREVV